MDWVTVIRKEAQRFTAAIRFGVSDGFQPLRVTPSCSVQRRRWIRNLPHHSSDCKVGDLLRRQEQGLDLVFRIDASTLWGLHSEHGQEAVTALDHYVRSLIDR